MSQLHLIRLVIETQSPMAINTGGRETGFDTQLARDANGLPYLPATSIAGVWRHLVQDNLDSATENAWFGTTDGRSALTISDGIVHDSHNLPITGLHLRSDIDHDPLLKQLVQERPHHRERVSINDRGVALDGGKFDQLLLPAGVRFTLDIRWDDDRLSDTFRPQWKAILHCWQDRRFALGSTTRNGLGKIKVIASKMLNIDLKTGPQAGKALNAFRTSRETPTQLDRAFDSSQTTTLLATLPLKAVDNWRCGSGADLLGKQTDEQSINILTFSEPRIQWTTIQGKIQGKMSKPEPVLCGSSIKGILAHRVAYHLRRHKGIWAETLAECSHDEWQQRPIELKALFGHADDEDPDLSLAGRLYVDDCEIKFTDTVIRHHNSIDRFTGGVRKGALFSEELLYQPEFTLTLWLAPHSELSAKLKKALEDTFNDLKTGLLPLGAGSGRGTSLVLQNPQQPWQVNIPEEATV